MTLVLRYAIRSDVGLLREGNEDSAYAGPRLLAVADGMGGHAAGEVASSLTIEAMSELDAEPPGHDMLGELSAAVASANARLQEMIVANPAVEGMGTTLTALFWSDGHAAVCHIGDSRGYLLREGELYQITHDHTLVQSLVDEGRISVDDVSTHPQRSLLLRALDGRSVAEPDLSVHDGHPGDRYLLCSDGLSGVVSDDTLRETLAALEDPEAVTRQLIDLALHGGGPDNITCIVADVVDTATTRVPPEQPILAGAAASAAELRRSVEGTGPFAAVPANSYYASNGNSQHPVMTVEDLEPSAVPLTIMGESPVRARRSHRAQPRRATRARRRWPIVTTALVVLLVVIVGGGFIAWQWSQDQYYVGANSQGQVVIYKGVNQRILGVSLSKPYQTTGIQLSQAPTNWQQTVKAADTATSLTTARNIVANIANAVSDCKTQYVQLQTWVKENAAYQAAVAQAKKTKKSVPANVTKPGPQPQKASAMCPPPTAFGIAASDVTLPTPGQS
jgi:PPM family protein phosphatase